MKLGTSAKLFLAILAACAAVLTANGIAGRISFERDFLGYLNEQGQERMQEVLPRIQAAYRQHGNWEFVRANPEAWFSLMRPEMPRSDAFTKAPPVSDQTGAVPRFALYDAAGQRLIGNPDADSGAIRLPVTVDGRDVGWLAMVPFQKAIAGGDLRFYQAQMRAWWVNGIASVVVAALLAWLLSRALLGRVRQLTDTIHGLAAGDFSHRVPSAGSDELGRLASDVNQLADALEHTERNRRSFMADISHELRTPLAVLRAEMEALQDGIRPLSPAALEPLQGEVQQLGKLVDDLHELAMTQSGTLSYRWTVLDLGALLQTTLSLAQGRLADAGLALDAAVVPEPLLVRGDERRLQQLLSNLLANSLRYTDAGGRLAARLQRQGDEAVLRIEDTAPGVPASHLAQLFERFYRVDGSRNRASGGSGLGLAICRNIAEAHGGRIDAQASALGGLCITVTLPCLP